MIYFDNAATTKMYDEAISEMLPYFNNIYANPSELYSFAGKSRTIINNSRKIIADSIKALPEEIYFTSGGTESDNWAISCAFSDRKYTDSHIITTSIEHHAILNTCKSYEKKGVKVTYIEPDEKGIINPEDIKTAIRPNTVLISVMMANNEIGTIQNIKEIARIAKEKNIIMHTDAVQAFMHINIDVNDLGIDMLSVSAHKCHGPKGIGFLYIRKGTNVIPFHHGGKQERLLRAGTENVPAIAGFGKAVEIGNDRLLYNIEYITGLRNHFIKRVLNEIEHSRLNGDDNKRLPGNINFGFAFVDGEALQIQLDLKDICCSTGSACNAGVQKVSHVLKSILVPEDYIHGSIRFTLCEFNTLEEVDYTVNELKKAVEKLRSMSIEYKRFKKSMS